MIDNEVAVLAQFVRKQPPPDPYEEWRDQAVCAQSDPEIWFPLKGGSTRKPKSLCLTCPVREECLEYALTHDERFGVWGGFSERERRRMQRGEKIELVVPERRINDAISPPFSHGEKGYQRGCRCVTCREGAARIRKEQRARKRARTHLTLVKDVAG